MKKADLDLFQIFQDFLNPSDSPPPNTEEALKKTDKNVSWTYRVTNIVDPKPDEGEGGESGGNEGSGENGGNGGTEVNPDDNTQGGNETPPDNNENEEPVNPPVDNDGEEENNG